MSISPANKVTRAQGREKQIQIPGRAKDKKMAAKLIVEEKPAQTPQIDVGSSAQKKQKGNGKEKEKITVDSLQWESLTANECKQWWNSHANDHPLKIALEKA